MFGTALDDGRLLATGDVLDYTVGGFQDLQRMDNRLDVSFIEGILESNTSNVHSGKEVGRCSTLW